ncbi:bifunctional MaoC family dehydratase N-terminal/OB-fold nucleic acid binding domain-containing protein [Streptomyces sp. NPDC059080]|uniref:bifunctional MaoC family dehydratase N-terminal/OB-fold nucleic acid binding domain-containing protein n=1 Tax=Streptomyces sp. NPDC059080 TaxID=3346718 RepID=UPI003691C4DF
MNGGDEARGAPHTAGTSGDGELYVRLQAFEGRPAATGGRGRDPVDAAMIRHWCEAMGDAHPAYRGPDAVAPPTMLQAWTMGGLSGHEGRSAAYDELFALLDGAGCTAVVATDCEQEYLRPLRPGDEITFDAVIESVSPRKTTKLGSGHFVTTRMEVRAGGELAGTHRFRILKYAPGVGSARGSASGAGARRGEPEAGAGARKGEPAAGPGARKGTPESAPEPAPEPAPAPSPASRKGPHRAVPARPRPVINRDNAGFWAGVAEHRLLVQRCGGCGRLRLPWLPGCARCGSPEWDTVTAAGTGTVHSYVVMHHPPFPAFDPPYAVALIALDEGVRLVAGVTGVRYDAVRIGMPVRLGFQQVTDAKGAWELPVFRAEPGAHASREES